MLQKTGAGFVLRGFIAQRNIARAARLAFGAALLTASAMLSGCADNPNSAYPSLANITGLGTILTPEERQKAVQDLEKQDPNHGQAAIKDIQKQP